MKADVGAKIKLTREVCYGTLYGLVKIPEGVVLTVGSRLKSDDGIETVEKIRLVNILGEKVVHYRVYDTDYKII